MGGWAVAQSPILVTTITLERLRKRGCESMLELYQKIAPHLNEPLYTACPVKREDPYVQWCEGFSGGLRLTGYPLDYAQGINQLVILLSDFYHYFLLVINILQN